MRASLAALLAAGVAACASTPPPKGTPTSFQPVCLPCPMPCTPETSCPQPKPAVAPVFSPAPGESTGSQQVTLSTPTKGAVIRYTTDGSVPTASSPQYTGPITVDKTTSLKAIAIAPGLPPSPVASGTFTVAPPPPPPPPPPPETPRVVVTREKLDLKEKVFFDSGKATIKPVSFGLLDEVAAVLKARDDVKKIRIEGHTDSSGSAAFNKKLSQERADAVRTYLVTKGIDPARLEAQGFGEEAPIADNKKRLGREENRRVELRVLE
jgi:outer membrane protein OmpA-like peptidoglycan-associated protein